MAAARCRRHMGDNPAHRADERGRESDAVEKIAMRDPMGERKAQLRHARAISGSR